MCVLVLSFTWGSSDDIVERWQHRRQDRRFSQARFKAKEQTRVVRRHIEPSMRNVGLAGWSYTSANLFCFCFVLIGKHTHQQDLVNFVVRFEENGKIELMATGKKRKKQFPCIWGTHDTIGYANRITCLNFRFMSDISLADGDETTQTNIEQRDKI